LSLEPTACSAGQRLRGSLVVRLSAVESHRKAQAEQIRSIAVERVRDQLGVVPNSIMLDLDEAMRLHLGL
jgi:mRNA interferase MazF